MKLPGPVLFTPRQIVGGIGYCLAAAGLGLALSTTSPHIELALIGVATFAIGALIACTCAGDVR